MDDFLETIPHRPPFLFVDRVVESTEDHIKTQKDVSPDEPFFRGHYPGRPIMPGVLILESVFQAAAILMGKRMPNPKGSIPVVTRVNQVKFKHAVVPGDVMEIEVRIKDLVEPACFLSGRVSVKDKTVATLDFAVMRVEDVK